MIGNFSSIIQSMKEHYPTPTEQLNKNELTKFYMTRLHEDMKKQGLQFYIIPKKVELLSALAENNAISVKTINFDKVNSDYFEKIKTRIVVVNEIQKEIWLAQSLIKDTPTQVAQIRVVGRAGQIASGGGDFNVRVRSVDEEQHMFKVFNEILELIKKEETTKTVQKIDAENQISPQIARQREVNPLSRKSGKSKKAEFHKGSKQKISDHHVHQQTIQRMTKSGQRIKQREEEAQRKVDQSERIKEDEQNYRIKQEDENKKNSNV
jgi:hypothetical protein